MNVKFILSSLFSAALLFTCFGASSTDFLSESNETSGQEVHQDGGEKKAKKFGSFLNKIKGAVEGVKEQNFIGTWSYTGTDMKLKGDDALTQIGGQLAAGKMEKNIDKHLGKLGIAPGRYVLTFNEDGTYTGIVNKRDIKGNYTYDKETQTIKMTSLGGLRNSEMTVEMVGENMSLLYDSSKFLDFAKGITGKVGQSSTSLKLIDGLLQKCQGMYIGMKFQKKI